MYSCAEDHISCAAFHPSGNYFDIFNNLAAVIFLREIVVTTLVMMLVTRCRRLHCYTAPTRLLVSTSRLQCREGSLPPAKFSLNFSLSAFLSLASSAGH